MAGILVVNERYFPDDELEPAQVGATSFSRSALRCLWNAGLSAGVILYKRAEELTEPQIDLTHRSGFRCATLRFNFDMGADTVSRAIAEAAARLCAAYGFSSRAMLYYQTDALLVFHPQELACCVTHHGPFVHDFVETFSARETAQAFGDAAKALHLFKHQELGVNSVRSNGRMFVLQHSQLQREYLISRGVDERRIRAIRPPIAPPTVSEPLRDERLRSFVEGAELLVFTAVARLDYFKNVELLVSGCVQARKQGVPLRILVVGDSAEDDVARQALRAHVPEELSAEFMAVGKLTKSQLYALFSLARSNGIFVCPSRYETLGITPLEAALSGVCTLMTDSEKVEARRFFPDAHRFLPSGDGLADAIGLAYASPSGVEQLGKELREAIATEISEENFERDTLSAWSYFSQSARQLDS
ncbi:glycosyltransferase family 4 protein [Streptomyces zagrosensis]|uniref:Glycosyltransferase involved in cell wall biosynthesis n=1 Tax=Streptomyces zagrosensis TaxID=1042984 RepID=A0A7W9QE39_9ACTN|nr:glycosyltransferase family 4 protein [Streptomyces zagrosensis]MBB5937342.1 glycosyltransferase involved in cell wall biosynthesis [Streptomyces zagrosensis]